MTTDYIMYGSENSYYSGKTRAYLRYKSVNWEEQLSTHKVYKEFILPRVGFGIIPVLHTADDEVVQDTTEIIDYIEVRHPEVSVYPESPKQRLAALLMEVYGDEWLIIPAMHYRWNFLEQQGDFIYGEFGRLGAPDGTLEERIAIGTKTGKPFKGITPILGVTDATIPAIEQGYLQDLEALNKLFSKQDYLFGSRPSIGDFGLMGPLYAHLGRDPYPKALMQEKAPAVYAWVERMNKPAPLSGEFAAGDVVADEVLQLLRVQAEDQLPFLAKTADHVASWLEQNPGGDIPRAVAMDSFTTHGATGERMVSAFSLWMYQRPYDYYHSLSGADKAAADDLLRTVGAYDIFQKPIPRRVARKRGQLELVAES